MRTAKATADKQTWVTSVLLLSAVPLLLGTCNVYLRIRGSVQNSTALEYSLNLIYSYGSPRHDGMSIFQSVQRRRQLAADHHGFS